MKEIIKIKVTREDLKAPYYSRHDCPIAKAVKRYFTSADQVDVFSTGVYVDYAEFKLSAFDNNKAYCRANNSLWGKLLGGFTVKLERV